MATADELLGMISDVTDEFLDVNLDTRIISIPTSIKLLGVESDDDVKHLRFRVPRNYGEFDLSTFSIQVNFENANGEGDFYLINDLAVQDDGTMSFTWLVDRHAFKRSGDVDFSLCMKKFDESGVVVKELNTAVATLPVLKGLETTKAVVEGNPSAFDSIMFRLYAVEAATGNSTNGYYTIASVIETDDGIELSIVGSDGASVATIRHGKDGEDGYCPVKGVDYWTEEDKTEIKTYIDTWAPRPETATLLASEWDTNTKSQTVSVIGVTTDNIVFVEPDHDLANTEQYNYSVVRCIEQGTNYLKFECSVIPESDLIVNVGVFYSTDTSSGAPSPAPTPSIYTMITADEIDGMFSS